MRIQRTFSALTFSSIILVILCVSLLPNLPVNHEQKLIQSQNTFSEKDISPRISSLAARVPVGQTILPSTNLTVTQYIPSQGQVNSFTTSVLSLNSTHWFTQNTYANTSNPSPFSSIVSRESINHSYPAVNYRDWFTDSESYAFEFWIDPTGLSIGHNFGEATVVSQENISMAGVGTFEAWNITANIGIGNFAFYEKNTGMILCTYLKIVEDIWFNLTLAEIATVPGGYTGPELDQIIPSNESILAPGSLISGVLSSPYGIHYLNYSWDNDLATTVLSSDYQTSLPSLDGIHNLSIVTFDNVGYSSSYLLEYSTDSSIPGIILHDPENNSRIKGSKELNISTISSNGTFIYNWDDGPSNVSLFLPGNSTLLNIPNPSLEITHKLQVFVKSITDLWLSRTYFFIIDNSAPTIQVFDFQNNSVLKGIVNVNITVSETSNISYSLNNDYITSFITEGNTFSIIDFENLTNGTYGLNITAEDAAGNEEFYYLGFSIYTSSFNWNWDLIAEQSQTIDFIDENDTYWFTFTIASKTDQSFNLSFLTAEDIPILESNMFFGVEISCEEPQNILFLTLLYPLPDPLIDENQSFLVYTWVSWDALEEQWGIPNAHYNQVSHAWETTINNFSPYFALIETDTSTRLKSVEVGGGSIPSFELPLVVITLIVFYGLKIKEKRKNGE